MEMIKLKDQIPESRNLELIKLDDCQFVATKGTHKEGDLVLVIRSGSIVPHKLLQGTGALRCLKNGRVRTLLLRGVMSDCLVVTMKDILRNIPEIDPAKITLGKELHASLGIDPPYEIAKKASSVWNQFKKSLRGLMVGNYE